MKFYTFPLRYLSLRSAGGSKLWLRDLPAAIVVGFFLSAPYLLVENSNYFHKDGFIDKIGTFASVLTGFYIAGLVAVATFPRNEAGLDKVIKVGAIILPGKDGNDDENLSRREYVCAMFGYLAFSSLVITTLSIICVTSSGWMGSIGDAAVSSFGYHITIQRYLLRAGVLAVCSIMLSHVFVTTVRGLYYLIDRIYTVAPTPLPRKED